MYIYQFISIIFVLAVFSNAAPNEVTCEAPVSPEHGSLHLVGEGKVNSLALYSCDDGWKLVGASASKCRNTGQWTSFPPRCIEKDRITPIARVPTPSPVPLPSPERKATPVVIETDDTDDTPLTPEHPEEKECSCTYNSHDVTLSAKVNGLGLRYGDKVKKGDKITISCYDQAKHLVLANGTRISESLEVTCDTCQTWKNDVLPSCGDVRLEITCKELKETGLMKISYTDNLSVGSIANFHCFAPGIKTGVARMQCLPNGEWSHSPPTCKKEACSVPLILYGYIKEQIVGSEKSNSANRERKIRYRKVGVDSVPSLNTTLFLVCHDRYIIQETGEQKGRIACSNGRWSPKPICIEKEVCSVPLILYGYIKEQIVRTEKSNSVKRERKIRYKKVRVDSVPSLTATLFLVCHDQYIIQETGEQKGRITCSDGRWLPKPVCIKNT